MYHDISVSFSPIGGSWVFLVVAVAAVTFLTLAAYRRRLRGTTGRWRYFALGLRLLALLLCLLAALRPSLMFKEKKKQAASIVVLIDDSSSMLLGDEVNGQSRWEVAMQTIPKFKEFAKTLGSDLDTRYFRFDAKLTELKDSELTKPEKPKGRETALGSAMAEVQKKIQSSSRRIAKLVIFSDFTSNNGADPLETARKLKDQGVSIVTVPLGTENAGAGQKDVALRDFATSATGFVKNSLEVKGTLVVRGFANRELPVELYVDGQESPVAKTTVKVPDGVDTMQVTGLKFTPGTAGEKRLTLKVPHQDGELVVSNNEMSTFVTILSGGLNVLFLQGSNHNWEYYFAGKAIGTSSAIQMEGVVIHRRAQGDKSEIDDLDFAPGKFNAYVFSDLSADFLTVKQHRLLVEAVKKGAGFLMLGGHSSFGAGGWADTPVAEILPAEIHAGDDQYEPEGGIKVVPTALGLDSFILQVGATRAETAKIWESMPPILGTNRFGDRKPLALVLATSPAGETEPLPLMMSMDGTGRVLAYGGETWVWARKTEEGRLAHRKFWRQSIFWLSHKEEDSENQVKLVLDRRRVGVGEKLELTATARDAKGVSILDVTYDCKIEREGPTPVSEPVKLFAQGAEARGSRFATDNVGQPANYTATVVAHKDGKELGRDTARFLVYQDDRELENPSADLKLAREISQLTEEESVTPEKLVGHLKGIDRATYTEYMSPTEVKVWDNWPFLLAFTAILVIEWWLRKRHGWV
jgi:uncharacterized membrane protein